MQVLPRAEGNRPTYSTTPARRIGARAREPLAGSMVGDIHILARKAGEGHGR
jgi:hypothetical protein